MEQDAFESLMKRFDEQDRRAQLRHEQLLERGRTDARLLVNVLGDIDLSIQRSADRLDDIGDRLDDMGEAIRANTRAVLSVIDRLEPGSAS